jgi:hypothetical protein
MKLYYFLLLLLAGLLACNDADEKEKDLTNKIDKDGAVETAVTTKHLNDSLDVLTTHHQVWVKGVMVKEITNNDTLPSLGILHTSGEDDKGNSKQLEVKRDYEIYITVK